MDTHFFSDTAVLSGRSLRHVSRSMDTIITIASGISYTAFRLFLDLQSGVFERFQSMPIARSAVRGPMW